MHQRHLLNNADGTWQKNHYNAQGLRSAVEENGIYTGFVYDGWNVVSEFNSHDEVIRTNVWGHSLLSSKDEVGRDYYYLNNLHSDVVNIIDQVGEIKNSYSYDAYGNIIASEELISNRYTYAGEQYDSVTGDYYLRARYYNSTTGRFFQEDTYRGDGLNLYCYVANNPIMYVDPSGHGKEDSSGDYTVSEFDGTSQDGSTSLINMVVHMFIILMHGIESGLNQTKLI